MDEEPDVLYRAGDQLPGGCKPFTLRDQRASIMPSGSLANRECFFVRICYCAEKEKS